MIEAEADLDRVLVIDEAKRELTLSDERIEKAITQNGARLIILDPIQAYMGEKTDMNRANEVRPMFRRLADEMCIRDSRKRPLIFGLTRKTPLSISAPTTPP